MMTPQSLGFDLVGIAACRQPVHYEAYRRWIAEEKYAGMNYLKTGCEPRKHPNSVLDGVQSLLLLGFCYEKVHAEKPVRFKNVAKYAQGPDYHRWAKERLAKLAELHRSLYPNGRCRGVVDTAPLLERSFAVSAGLGWIGKNTMLINERFGSRFFLAAMLSTECLDQIPFWTNLCNVTFDEKRAACQCGDCRKCLDACPMSALAEPFQLDARRCLNYWTIEHRGEIPPDIKEHLGEHFFGCDRCQDVCPRNVHVGSTVDDESIPEVDLMSLTQEEFFDAVKGTPIERKVAPRGIASKKSLRQIVRDRLDDITGDRSEYSATIWNRLRTLAELEQTRRDRWLVYLDMPTEVETTRFVTLPVVVPCCVGRDIVPIIITSLNELAKNRYGILEPAADPQKIVAASDLHVVLVPGLAFDVTGNRLGRGGGYYDRFLANCPDHVLRIALAFECQIVESVPVSEHDQPVDVIVTEKRIIRTTEPQ